MYTGAPLHSPAPSRGRFWWRRAWARGEFQWKRWGQFRQCLMLTVTLARRPLNLGLKSLRMKWFLMTRVPLIRSHVLKYLADGWVVHTTGRAGRKSMPSKNWMPTRSWPRIHVFNWSNVFLFMTVRRFIVKVLGDHFWLISFTFKP